jgi:hypothetical protein
MAVPWDGSRQRVLLFGGWDATDARDDLWSWDGASWAPVT